MGQRNINSTNNYRSIGSIPNNLECNLKKLGISYNVRTLQKFVFLGTTNILRKVLSIKEQRLENNKGWEKEIVRKKEGLVVSNSKTFIYLELK